MNYLIDCKGAYARCIHIPQNQRFKILLRMKLLIISLLLFLGQATASVMSQTLTLHFTNAPLDKVLTEIKKQTGYSYIANVKLLKEAKTVTVSVRNANVNDVLKVIFKDQNLSVELTDGVIYIEAKKGEAIQKKNEKDQDAIRGRVTDQDGKALAGATVKVKGTNIVSVTDQAGEFTLPAPDLNSTIEVTFLGYRTTETNIDGRKNIPITLQQALGQIDQIVVQGYGTTTKRLSTGNIATISAKEIEQQPVTNPLQALSGRMAGVQVVQGNGLPGSGIQVKIRGRNSIAASNNPLYIVDGVPFTGEQLGESSSVTFVGVDPLNSIPPDNIESISVLKDADATAIYGSRAANGVILITTKQGVAGKTTFDLNANKGFSSVTRTATPMNTEQYLELRRNAFTNSNITPTATSAPDLMAWDQSLDNNLQDWYLANTAQVFNTNAALSGGNSLAKFRLSGNYHQETTIFSKNDKYKRGNLTANVSHLSADSRFKVNFSGIYTSDNNFIQNGLAAGLSSIASSVPNYPIYDAAGNYNWISNQMNYYANAKAYWKGSTDNLNANLVLEYKILDDLTVKGSAGYNKVYHQAMKPQPATSNDPNSFYVLGYNTFSSNNIRNVLFEPQIAYNPDLFGGKVDILVGSTIQQRASSRDMLFKIDYPNDLLIESKNAGSPNYNTGTYADYKFISLFSRINYNWKSRYIINANIRRDGSSRFGPGKQFGNFGSIGAAWIFSNEHFIADNIKWLSHGKIRSSYGTTVSDGIGDYAYLSLYNTTINYGTIPAFIPGQIGNNEYRWEVNKKFEVALDLGFLQDRILFNTSYYRNRSGNQLVQYPLPTTTGFTGYTANLPAIIENKGWELELSTENIQKGNLKWSTSVNLTLPENRLVEFPNIEKTSYANSLVLGKPLNAILGYRFTGIDPLTGIPSVEDINGNGTISTNSSYNEQGGDRIYIGTTDPKWFAGLSNTVNFKGIQLAVFLQYTRQKSHNLYSQQGAIFGAFGTMRNYWVDHLDYWKSPNDGSTLPKPFASSNAANGNFGNSDFAFSDASFFRVKNIALSYQIPSSLTKRFGLTGLTVTMNGQNLWTITDYIGYDPENSLLALPPLRTIQVGLKANL